MNIVYSLGKITQNKMSRPKKAKETVKKLEEIDTSMDGLLIFETDIRKMR